MVCVFDFVHLQFVIYIFLIFLLDTQLYIYFALNFQFQDLSPPVLLYISLSSLSLSIKLFDTDYLYSMRYIGFCYQIAITYLLSRQWNRLQQFLCLNYTRDQKLCQYIKLQNAKVIPINLQ